jgi:hypothetical protein
VGADSDEEEKRAVRARAANADQSSTAEGRNQSAAADVSSDLLDTRQEVHAEHKT